MKKLNENDLSNIFIGCDIEVHKQLGPGLLESAYQECLFYELINSGVEVVEKTHSHCLQKHETGPWL